MCALAMPSNLLVLDATDFHVLMEEDPRIATRVHAVVRERIGREIVSPRGDIVAGERDPKALARHRTGEVRFKVLDAGYEASTAAVRARASLIASAVRTAKR